LRFVKRVDPDRPWRFPGNTNAHSGTTMQSVIRALLERLKYLQNQVWALENVPIIFALRCSLWLLEFRAARRHHRCYWHGFTFAETSQLCPRCGHTTCEHVDNAQAEQRP
jgi:hypothetical protein